jgi:hypothetical protein
VVFGVSRADLEVCKFAVPFYKFKFEFEFCGNDSNRLKRPAGVGLYALHLSFGRLHWHGRPAALQPPCRHCSTTVCSCSCTVCMDWMNTLTLYALDLQIYSTCQINILPLPMLRIQRAGPVTAIERVRSACTCMPCVPASRMNAPGARGTAPRRRHAVGATADGSTAGRSNHGTRRASNFNGPLRASDLPELQQLGSTT